jgi:hypothetical protein
MRRPVTTLLIVVAASFFLTTTVTNSFIAAPYTTATLFTSSLNLEKRRGSIQTVMTPVVTADADNEASSTATDAEDSDSGIGLSSTTLDTVVEYATSYAAANGLQVQASTKSESSSTSITTETQQPKQYIAAPVSLLPQAYPALLFHHAITLACPFGILVDRVSRDGHFLQTTLKQTRQVDIFTNQLLVLYEEIYMDNMGSSGGSGGEEGRKDMEYGKYAKMADRLGILRSDYMLHRNTAKSSSDDKKEEEEEEEESCHNNNNYYTLKQVELNTIASSFAGLSCTVAKMHSYLTRRMMLIEEYDDDDNNRMGGEITQFLNRNINAVMMGVSSSDSSEVVVDNGVPESPAMMAIPKAISVAYNRYCTRFIHQQQHLWLYYILTT